MAKLKVNKRKIGHVPENVFAGYLAHVLTARALNAEDPLGLHYYEVIE